MHKRHRALALRIIVGGFAVAAGALTIATGLALRPIPTVLPDAGSAHTRRIVYADRHGERLNATYENRWNIHDRIALHRAPQLLIAAFIAAEDRRFATHDGVDWTARAAAALANLRAGRVVRGASTISEQVVRMLHPRARTPWSRWLEGFEAAALERAHGKPAILEFYLNQVPYAARRRGVVQAARYYFDRDLATLNEKELLALAVIVRAPRWFDPRSRTPALERGIRAVAHTLHRRGELALDGAEIAAQNLSPRRVARPVNVAHFLRYLNELEPGARSDGITSTTLDLTVQRSVQQILDRRLADLAGRHVHNAAVLAVDHTRGEVLAWVVGHAGQAGKPFTAIDAVTVRRQPGSALKPLLYTEALQQGLSAASVIDDAPLEQNVGLGLHAVANYSHRYYGPVSVREALGNSLNTPAVRVAQFVGAATFIERLRELGINSLTEHPNVYGDGIALGNGEVTLFELVQAYTVLARMGEFAPLRLLAGDTTPGARIFSADVASLIADILSDPHARELEFGPYSILNFAAPTAVKTGTSSDYRDAWAIGYDDRYTVGVWMGNLDYTAMHDVTGSTGPALVLRATLRELNRHRERGALYRSPNLVQRTVCRETGLPPDAPCATRDEWFVRGLAPRALPTTNAPLRLRKPINGLRLAMDPRIPDEHEVFQFELAGADTARRVHWFVNGEAADTTSGGTYAWPLARGRFTTFAEIEHNDGTPPTRTATVTFEVQ